MEDKKFMRNWMVFGLILVMVIAIVISYITFITEKEPYVVQITGKEVINNVESVHENKLYLVYCKDKKGKEYTFGVRNKNMKNDQNIEMYNSLNINNIYALKIVRYTNRNESWPYNNIQYLEQLENFHSKYEKESFFEWLLN